MRYCFDLDDTISVHENRDYENARPIEGIVASMRKIKETDPEAHILIFTARGMNSCKGDARLAEEKNRPTIERWLERYGVPYDEILFGKPLADFYIDDKAIQAQELATEGVRIMQGYSGASVISVGNMVVKQGERNGYEREWYRRSEALKPYGWKTPRVYALTLGKLYMERVKGDTMTMHLKDCGAGFWKYRRDTINRALWILSEMSKHPEGGENDIKGYADRVRRRAEEIGLNVEAVCRRIETDPALEKVTFCHGDFTTANILIGPRGGVWLIDPTPSHIRTWLTDAAKFRASINGLTAAIEGREDETQDLVSYFDQAIGEEYRETIHNLEQTHIIRVMYYAKKRGDTRAYERLENMLEL